MLPRIVVVALVKKEKEKSQGQGLTYVYLYTIYIHTYIRIFALRLDVCNDLGCTVCAGKEFN